MTLLEFARGPGFEWALGIFIFGILWRFIGTIALWQSLRLSANRRKNKIPSGMATILTRSLPPPELEESIRFQHLTGYVWHIGFLITVFLFEPHISFFKHLLGVSWPGLANGVITVLAAITLAVLLALLIRRMIHPVMKLISNFDDYVSLLVTALPLLTGLLANAHLILPYQDMFAVHLLSVELLLIWFPFGKLMHALMVFPSRYLIGSHYARQGVDA